MNSMPRGFGGPPMRRGILRGMMPRGMGFRYTKKLNIKMKANFFKICFSAVDHQEEVQDVGGPSITTTKIKRNV